MLGAQGETEGQGGEGADARSTHIESGAGPHLRLPIQSPLVEEQLLWAHVGSGGGGAGGSWVQNSGEASAVAGVQGHAGRALPSCSFSGFSFAACLPCAKWIPFHNAYLNPQALRSWWHSALPVGKNHVFE